MYVRNLNNVCRKRIFFWDWQQLFLDSSIFLDNIFKAQFFSPFFPNRVWRDSKKLCYCCGGLYTSRLQIDLILFGVGKYQCFHLFLFYAKVRDSKFFHILHDEAITFSKFCNYDQKRILSSGEKGQSIITLFFFKKIHPESSLFELRIFQNKHPALYIVIYVQPKVEVDKEEIK